jgi:hypothetical protein
MPLAAQELGIEVARVECVNIPSPYPGVIEGLFACLLDQVSQGSFRKSAYPGFAYAYD